MLVSQEPFAALPTDRLALQRQRVADDVLQALLEYL